MNDQKAMERAPGETPGAGRAEHGSPTEVTWHGGKGRQPYSNQGKEESGPPAAGAEFEAGNRGEVSGRNLDQMDEAKGTPGSDVER